MAVTSKMFGNFPVKALNKELKWAASGGDTFRVALYTGAIPGTAQDAWVYKSNIATITEATGTGYTAGGQALTSQTIAYDASTNKTTLDSADVTWANSTISATCAIVYQDTGTASTSCLVAYIDFGETKASSDGNFTISWSTDGICSFTVS